MVKQAKVQRLLTLLLARKPRKRLPHLLILRFQILFCQIMPLSLLNVKREKQRQKPNAKPKVQNKYKQQRVPLSKRKKPQWPRLLLALKPRKRPHSQAKLQLIHQRLLLMSRKPPLLLQSPVLKPKRLPHSHLKVKQRNRQQNHLRLPSMLRKRLLRRP